MSFWKRERQSSDQAIQGDIPRIVENIELMVVVDELRAVMSNLSTFPN